MDRTIVLSAHSQHRPATSLTAAPQATERLRSQAHMAAAINRNASGSTSGLPTLALHTAPPAPWRATKDQASHGPASSLAYSTAMSAMPRIRPAHTIILPRRVPLMNGTR